MYFKLDIIILFIYSLFSLFSLYNLYKREHILNSLKFIYITNFMQSITFFYKGFGYFFLLGPSFSLYIDKEVDLFTRLKLSIYNLRFSIESIQSHSITILGLNIIHFIIAIYVYVFSKKYSN